ARVIGGGEIIISDAAKHKRFDSSVLEDLEIQMRGSPTDSLLRTIAATGLLGLEEKKTDKALVEELLAKGRAVSIEGVLFHGGTLETLAEQVLSLASAYQKKNPLRYGIDKEELRQKTQFPHQMMIFNKVLEQLRSFRPIFIKKSRVRADREEFSLPADLQHVVNRLEKMIRSKGLLYYSRKELEAEWREKTPLTEIIHLLVDEGSISAVGSFGYIHRDALQTCYQKLEQLFAETDEISVADVKDACGLSRKHVIPLLEWMDAERITTRAQNVRKKGPAFSVWGKEGKDSDG
ncbi:MAG: SelB C-terminal domain-containing protein, partial [Candidatus Latescibacterota bacterium]